MITSSIGAQESTVGTAIEGAPGFEVSLLGEELVGEVDVGFAVEQVTQVQVVTEEVDGIDLEVTPVERAVGIVVVDFALTVWILSALNGEGDAAIGAELLASVFLPTGERLTALIGAGLGGEFGVVTEGDKDRPAEVNAKGPLKGDGEVVVGGPGEEQYGAQEQSG